MFSSKKNRHFSYGHKMTILIIQILVATSFGQTMQNEATQFAEYSMMGQPNDGQPSISRNTSNECKPEYLPQCMNITFQVSEIQFLQNGHGIRVPIGYDTGGISNYSVAPDNTSVVVCYPLSPQLQQCTQTCHSKGSYQVENHTLLKSKPGKETFLADLGDYFIDENGNAITCNVTISTGKRTRCNHITLLNGDYRVFDNGTLYSPKLNVAIYKAKFQKDATGQRIKLCYPLDIPTLNCDPCRLEKMSTFEVMSDYSISPSYFPYKIKVGQYYYENNTDIGPYGCFPTRSTLVKYFPRDKILTVIFRTFLVFSAFFLILAIIIQLTITQKFTCYDKCLLCHNISVGVFYVNVAICWYCNLCYFQSLVRCSALFAIGYLSQMATYCWLCVCAFHVWQSFTKLHMTTQTVSTTTSNKHRFIYYSIFAWGTPIMMCVLILVITFSPSLMKSLSLDFYIECNTWFTGKKARFLFYSGPIVIVTIINIGFFISTMHSIRSAINETQLVNSKRKKQLFLICIKLSIATGVGWIVEGIVWLLDEKCVFPIKSYWYLPDFFISIQGIAISSILIWRDSTQKQLNCYLSKKKIAFCSNLRRILKKVV